MVRRLSFTMCRLKTRPGQISRSDYGISYSSDQSRPSNAVITALQYGRVGIRIKSLDVKYVINGRSIAK